MSAETIATTDPGSSTAFQIATDSDGSGGGAGRGGSESATTGPLVVVQQPRSASPSRPAPSPSRAIHDNSLRNGYAAISHSVSGETAAIGLGFLAAGPVGAIAAGAAAPVILAAMMWRSRKKKHDESSNGKAPGTTTANRSGSNLGSGFKGSGGSRNGSGNRGPNSGGTGGTHRKPKTKDPVLDALGKGLGKFKPKNAGKATDPKNGSTKDPKNSPAKGPKPGAGTGPSNGRTKPGPGSKGDKPNTSGPKTRQKPKLGGLLDSLKGGRKPKNGGSTPGAGNGKTDKVTGRGKHPRRAPGGDVAATTGRDGLDPKHPTGGAGIADEVIDAELVDDFPPKPDYAPDDVIDAEVVDEDRIALVRARREKNKRRAVAKEAKKAAERAARDGTFGDPDAVKAEVIREGMYRIAAELRREEQLLALAEDTENRRSTPVNYPASQIEPAGTSTPGSAVARQVDPRTSDAYRILRALADQLANGVRGDADADMADRVVELVGIGAMCKNLAAAVQAAGAALAKTAPLHPAVIKHLNDAAIAARTAGVMADQIMVVFVQAHREDIIRVLDPRVGEERWNIRNAAGTLDAAKLRAALASAHTARAALPGSATPTPGGPGSGRLVPASGESTKKLVDLMKGFDKGHMVNVLSEVNGAAAGVDAVADAVTRLYRRMSETWPTEIVVDNAVRATASKVASVGAELRKAVNAAKRAHARELKLNAQPRKGAKAESAWDVAARRSN